MNETRRIEIENPDFVQQISPLVGLGAGFMQERTGATVSTLDGGIFIEGDPASVELVKAFLEETYYQIKKGIPIHSDDLEDLFTAYARQSRKSGFDRAVKEKLVVKTYLKSIVPKTENQKLYVELMRHKDIVFSIGPAGTGKTYLAMAMAISYLKTRRIKRIIMARPAVEAGEKLGFLPGDIAEKVNPYLRPLFDALYSMVDMRKAAALIEDGVLEVAPLAFMRGRTLNDAFVILDEAQNTKPEQMKMFLTRIGFNTRAVITGDITQTDLPPSELSGLAQALQLFTGIEEIGMVRLQKQDIVRHPVVQKIVEVYEKVEADKNRSGN